MRTPRAIVIGAGIGGLTAAVDLARAGMDVEVVERASAPGGRMRRQGESAAPIDAGPTVFTMREVFEGLFDDAGSRLADHLELASMDTLARHAWPDDDRLDLFADVERTADAIAAFSSPRDAQGYRRFAADTQRMYDVLDASFMRAQRPGPIGLSLSLGPRRIPDLLATRPFTRMWPALGSYFDDVRLKQLFGRYATYCGATPFAAPATLMLIAHAERAGVWRVEGGMYRLAQALEALGTGLGARYRYGDAVRSFERAGDRMTAVVTDAGHRVEGDVFVFNGDVAALANGVLGAEATRAVPMRRAPPRSLSAVTFTGRARAGGFPLAHHTVLFSGDYAEEFREISRTGGPARDPTIYICAQDRDDQGARPVPDRADERMLVLVNARADGDSRTRSDEDTTRYWEDVLRRARMNGLELEREGTWTTTTPADFETAFPATGGALYGRAIHGFMASFRRPASRTRIANLYLAGGSVHPGAGVPMVATSGRLAAQAILTDLVSTSGSLRTDTSGGTSTA